MKRDLGLFDVFIITVGSLISAEIFLFPGMGYAIAGLLAILLGMGTVPLAASAIFISASVAWYRLYAIKRIRMEH